MTDWLNVPIDAEDDLERANAMFAQGRALLYSSKPHDRDQGRALMNKARKIHKRLK